MSKFEIFNVNKDGVRQVVEIIEADNMDIVQQKILLFKGNTSEFVYAVPHNCGVKKL